MESSDDKHWAQRYLLDPLHEPDPSQETGLGSSFRPAPAAKASPATTLPSPPTSPISPNNRWSRNPYRKDSVSSQRQPGMISSIARSASLSTKSPTTNTSELPHRSNTHGRNTSGAKPASASASASSSPVAPSQTHRQDAFSNLNESSPKNGSGTPGRRRGSSLTSRFPGDKSHQPLATLAKEKYIADRSSHVTRKHHIQPDIIDALDDIAGASYHHSGPYDATLYARNNSVLSSPVQAVAGTNAEALKATPRDKILDSVQGHRPLDGVAVFPPGATDRDGHRYEYEEGDNMMIGGGHEPEGGAYKRWPGVQYDPNDVKGKGEPSYSIEKALKQKKEADRAAGAMAAGEGDAGIEMTSPRARRRAGTDNGVGSPDLGAEGETSGATVGRSMSFSKRLSGGGLKKRIGSIKKHLHSDSR